MHIYIVEAEKSEHPFFIEAFDEHELHFVKTLEEVGEDAEIVSIFIYSKLNAAFLDRHPGVRMIATRSSAFDHIDVEECERRGVIVSLVRNYGENTVAEHTFALILALARKIRPSLDANQKRHFSYEALRGFDLENKVLGIVGTGRIGIHVIRIAKAFNMKVVAYDIYEKPLLAAIQGFKYVTFDQLLAEADVITLHLPLVPQTHHLFNREAFAKCRRGVLLINTARGGLVETDALIEALDAGMVGAAGLDVLEEERVMQREALNVIGDQIISKLHSGLSANELRVQNPERIQELTRLIRNQELISRPNVVFTPHVAFNSREAVERIGQTTVENIRSFLRGRPQNQVTTAQTPEGLPRVTG